MNTKDSNSRQYSNYKMSGDKRVLYGYHKITPES